MPHKLFTSSEKTNLLSLGGKKKDNGRIIKLKGRIRGDGDLRKAA